MNYRIIRYLRNFFFALIYISALGVAGVLVYQTFLLTSEMPTPLIIGATTSPASPTPEPTHNAVAMATTPTPTPATLPVTTDIQFRPDNRYYPKTGRYVAAWLPPSFSGGARASFEANKDIIDEVSPFWYHTDSSGRLIGTRDDEFVRIAHENNILVIPTIHNIADFRSVINILSDPQLRTWHIQNILDEVLARNYDGIDIDYEALDPSMREDFSIFIRDLANVLHSHNKMLTVAVHAKDNDFGGMGGYQDWVVLGQYVDRLRIMTYDYHWRGSGPGPVAPLYWVQSVAQYARSVVDPAKVVIGVPFYGYDWPPGGTARGLPWSDIEDLIASQGLTVNLMERNSRGLVDESWFVYQSAQGTREVWFMTDKGLESKLDLVQELDLAGIAIWQLGYERPEYWRVIRRKLVEDPALIQRSINPLLPEH